MNRVIRCISFFLLLGTMLARADSIDDAEAKRRGVPVDQVIAERQRDQAQQQVKDLKKQIADLKSQIAELDKNNKGLGAQLAKLQDPSSSEQPADPSPASQDDASGETVHVSGYTRKDGTYVAPYDRSPPHRK